MFSGLPEIGATDKAVTFEAAPSLYALTGGFDLRLNHRLNGWPASCGF
jgi:hypothetical protein